MNYQSYYNGAAGRRNEPPNDFERMTKNRKVHLGYGGQASTLGDGTALSGYNSGPLQANNYSMGQGMYGGGMGGGQQQLPYYQPPMQQPSYGWAASQGQAPMGGRRPMGGFNYGMQQGGFGQQSYNNQPWWMQYQQRGQQPFQSRNTQMAY
jgi:hypothetical protein